MTTVADPPKAEQKRQNFIELSPRQISVNAEEYKCERLNSPVIRLYERILGSERSSANHGFASGYDIAFEAFERMLGTYKAARDELESKYGELTKDKHTKRFMNLYSFYIATVSLEKEISKHIDEASPVQFQNKLNFEKEYSIIEQLAEEYVKVGKGSYNAKDLGKRTKGYLQFFERFLRLELEKPEYAKILNGLENKSIFNPDAGLRFHGLNYIEIKMQRHGKILTFEDMGGNAKAKSEAYLLSLRLSDEEACVRNNIDIFKGLLFEGPPGTGKTFLGKIIADTCGKNFIEINLTDFMSKYYGESEEKLSKMLSVKNSVIFFDEIDAVCPRQGGEDSEGLMGRITNQIAKHLQGFQTDKGSSRNVYIAATNRRHLIDTKILRAGRFDKIITFDYPTEPEMSEILEIHLKRSDSGSETKFFDNVCLAEVANALYQKSMQVKKLAEANPKQEICGISGSDIKEIVERVRDFRWNAKYFGHPLAAATDQDFIRIIADYEAEKRG